MPEDPPSALFVYGTLLFAEVRRQVVSAGFETEPAVLPGHARYRVRGEPYPALLPERGAETPGLLVHGVPEPALHRLDRFEGPLYVRAEVLALGGSERMPTRAWAWLLAPGEESRLERLPWDPELFRAHDLPRFLARGGS